MVNAGRILILTKGDWNSLTTYEMLDLVSKGGIAYLARQSSVGVDPSTDTQMTYWQPFGSASDIATTTTPGIVMPDGQTIKIGTGGLIYVDMNAAAISYDNTATGVTADKVQSAIDTAIIKAQMALNGIAPIEESSTASTAHAVGSFFFYNGNLYKTTTAISQGGTITPGTNCTQKTVGNALKELEADVSSLNSAIANKINTSDIANNLTTTTTGKVLDATQGLALANKHKVTRKTVDTSSWSSDTSSQSGTTLYKKSISLSHVYVDCPSVDISTSSGSGLPTTAQQTAYDLLQYVTVDGTTMYLYASAIPTDTFYIQIEGVD